uniref:Uncharacterized protein n=1 Tax=Oryza nivara TaxID=4536 RepID=A0A0E0IBF6_ORYNI
MSSPSPFLFLSLPPLPLTSLRRLASGWGGDYDNLNYNLKQACLTLRVFSLQATKKEKHARGGGAEEVATGVGEAAAVVETEEAVVGCLPGGHEGGRCRGQREGGGCCGGRGGGGRWSSRRVGGRRRPMIDVGEASLGGVGRQCGGGCQWKPAVKGGEVEPSVMDTERSRARRCRSVEFDDGGRTAVDVEEAREVLGME